MKKKNAKTDPNANYVNKRRNILTNNSSFHVQEAYKLLRTNVRFSLSGKGCKKLCITSCNMHEGKSITILNLAISLAQTGQRVLLVDSDMRRPCLAKLLIEKPEPGLSNYLAGLCSLNDVVHPNVYENLDVILSGDIPPNPSELMGNDNMQLLLEEMGKCYDYILVDLPPVGVVADACVIANSLDGVLFLVRQNRAERDSVAACIKQLELSGAKLLGFVLNGVQGDGKNDKYGTAYGYGYGYGYGRTPSDKFSQKTRKRAKETDL